MWVDYFSWFLENHGVIFHTNQIYKDSVSKCNWKVIYTWKFCYKVCPTLNDIFCLIKTTVKFFQCRLMNHSASYSLPFTLSPSFSFCLLSLFLSDSLPPFSHPVQPFQGPSQAHKSSHTTAPPKWSKYISWISIIA